MRDWFHALTGDASLRGQLLDWDSAVRSPLSTALRVGFVQLSPGVGASTLAVRLSGLLATRRAQPVLLVDVVGGPRGAAARLGIEPSPASRARLRARTSAQAVEGLRTGPEGQWVLYPGRPASDGPTAWISEVAPLARFFDVVLTDFGTRHPLVDLAASAALCDVVCVVAAADRGDAEMAASLVDAFTGLPEKPRVVLALVDQASTAGLAPMVIGENLDAPVVTVGFDRGLAAGMAPTSLRARAALLELGAALIKAKAGQR